MKQMIKNSFDISLKNWPVLLAFNMVYKMFSYSVLYSITSELLELILKTAGVSYLSAENLSLILRSPISVLLCLGIVFVTVLSVFFEIVASYVYCEAGWNQRRISIVQMLRQTLVHCRKIFHLQNGLLFLGFILTTILSVLPFSPYLLQWLGIPEFVMDFIKHNRLLFVGFLVIVVIANIICFLFLFFLPNTLFQNQSMKDAWKDGLTLLKKKKIASILRVLVSFVVFGFVVILFLGLSILGLVSYTKYVGIPAEWAETFIRYFCRAVPAAAFVVNSLSTIWLIATLISLYHQYREDDRPSAVVRDKRKPLFLLKQAAVIAFAVIAVLIFSESELGGSFVNETHIPPQIVAHRGGAAFAGKHYGCAGPCDCHES